MSDLYETDILDWSERQADLLRRHAAGERLNDHPDWPNIIDEIESVGRAQLNAVQSLLVQAMLHDLKASAWPNHPALPHWRAQARGFRDDAARIFAPSMRARIDIAAFYRQALRRLPESMDGIPPRLPASGASAAKHWTNS